MRKNILPKRKNSVDWQKIVLLTLKGSAVISVALLAPNAFKMFKLFDKKHKRINKYKINRAAQALQENGLIRKTSNGWALTKRGKDKLRNFEFQTKKHEKPKWDKLWRQIIFDISNRHVRDRVREFIQNAGFVMIQKSVWMYPYPCTEVIRLLKTEFQLKDDLLYSVIVKLDSKTEAKLKSKFKLK